MTQVLLGHAHGHQDSLLLMIIIKEVLMDVQWVCIVTYSITYIHIDATGLAMMGFAIGMMCSPPVSGLLLQYLGPKSPFLAATGLCVLDFVLRLSCMTGAKNTSKHKSITSVKDAEDLTVNTAGDEESATEKPINKPLRSQLAAMFCYGPVIPLLFLNFMSSFSISALEITYPLFMAHTMDASPGQIGVVFGIINICFGVFSFLGGLLADKLGRAPILVVGTSLFSAALCTISFPNTIYVAGGVGVCIDIFKYIIDLHKAAVGSLAGIGGTASMPLMSDAAQATGVGGGLIFGIWNAAYGMGMALGPPVGGMHFSSILVRE